MNIHREQNENEEKFLWRLGQAKDSGELDLDWSEIANIMNAEFRDDETEYMGSSAYRKLYQCSRRFFDAGVFNKYQDGSYIEDLREAKQELRKEKQRLFDERTAYNKELREQGRRESMVDIVKHAIDEYCPTVFEDRKIECRNSDDECDFIVHLTDIHYGINIDNILNKCDSDILTDRLYLFLGEIESLVKLYKPKNCYLIAGGDFCMGLIHLNARLEAKENLVMQIMKASDMIANFIYKLSSMFESVHVYSTAGNHSRVMPNKEHVARNENFDVLIPYICKKELQNVKNVHFYENELGCDIATFDVRGHRVYATHGDKDSNSSVVYNMTKFARKAGLPLPDMCYLGHRHTNGLTTVDTVKVIESGCVGGMDSYAIDHRLVGMPEQTVTVVTEDCKIKALCDIQLT